MHQSFPIVHTHFKPWNMFSHEHKIFIPIMLKVLQIYYKQADCGLWNFLHTAKYLPVLTNTKMHMAKYMDMKNFKC